MTMRTTDREFERVPFPVLECRIVPFRKQLARWRETLMHIDIAGRSLIDIAMHISQYIAEPGERIMLTDHATWYVWRAGSGGSVTWVGTRHTTRENDNENKT